MVAGGILFKAPPEECSALIRDRVVIPDQSVILAPTRPDTEIGLILFNHLGQPLSVVESIDYKTGKMVSVFHGSTNIRFGL